MRRIVAAVVAILAMMVSVFVVASSASAANKPGRPMVYVWVAPGVSTQWQVNAAVAYVNRYTYSNVRVGYCRDWAPCITITQGPNPGLNSATNGYTYPEGGAVEGKRPWRAHIVLIGSRLRVLNSSSRRLTVIHELGHASGLWNHSHDRSVMTNPMSRASFTFNRYQRGVLSRN